MNKEQPELTALQLAYNQGIEDAMCAIRAESQGGGYWAATYINAIARRCSPFWYVAAKFTAPTYDQAVQAITDIRGARESHVQWAAHLRDTKRKDCKGCDDHAAHIGDAAYHDEWITKYDNVIYVLAHAPFTAAAATPSPETPKSNDARREWFDRIGDKASAEVVNATADLVTNERLAALTQAGVVPSPETPEPLEFRTTKEAMEYAARHKMPNVIPIPAPVPDAGDDEDRSNYYWHGPREDKTE